MDLFTYAGIEEQQPEPECDHLPVGQREFIDEWLVCSKCGKKLRQK